MLSVLKSEKTFNIVTYDSVFDKNNIEKIFIQLQKIKEAAAGDGLHVVALRSYREVVLQ